MLHAIERTAVTVCRLPAACARSGLRFKSSGPTLFETASTTVVLPVNHVDPPSADAVDAIVEARRQIFGIVAGNNQRSGRKVLRSHLRGAALGSYYPVDVLADLPLAKLGIENPEVEDRYRREQELQRIGKSLRKGKARPPTERFLTRMALEDKQEEILEQVDYFNPEDALPDEEAVEHLMENLDAQEREWVREIFGKMVLEAERGRADRLTKAGAEISKDDKKARARKVAFRQGLQDKRRKDQAEGAFGLDAEPEEAAEVAAAEGEAIAEAKEAAAGDSGLSEEDQKVLEEIQQLLASKKTE